MNTDVTYQPEGGVWAPYRLPFPGVSPRNAGVCHLNIGDVYFALRGDDGSGLMVDAQKAAEAAGVKGSEVFNKKFGDALKSGAGAAVGAAFGMAVTSGADLDKAMGQLKQDTGMVGDEAENAKHALIGMYQGGIESMDQISQTMAKVRSDFSLTGDAANETAKDYMTYETATKQGAEAVDEFSKVIKAWNLNVDDSKEVMDALVYSHQAYGTNIANNQEMLAKLAPTLLAANLTWKDGLGLLNMFQAAGLDASKSTTAMTTALSKVKSPAELQKLMSDIENTVNPFARAQLAVELFGKKAGPQMAALLSQGNIGQYTEDVKDYTGATEAAAQAVEDEWGNRAIQAYHNVAGALSEIGSAMGPVMSVAGLLPEKVTTAITTGLGALAPKLIEKIKASILGTIPASVVAGTAEGVATGEAVVAAEAATVAAGGPEVAAGVLASGGAATAAGGTVGTAMGMAMGAMAAIAIPVAIAAGAAGIILAAAKIFDPSGANHDQWRKDALAGSYGTIQQREAQNEQDRIDAAAAQKGIDGAVTDQISTDAPTMATALQAGIDGIVTLYQTSGKTVIAQAAKDGYQGIPTAMQAAQFESGLALQKGVDGQISAIKSARSGLTSAWTDALDTARRPQEIDIEMRQTLGDINLAKLKLQGKSMTAWERDNAALELGQAQDKYAKLLVESATYGTEDERIKKLGGILSNKALLDGLKSGDPDTVEYWKKVQAETQTQMDVLNGIMNTGGNNAGKAFYDALMAQLGLIEQTSWQLPGGQTYKPGDQEPIAIKTKSKGFAAGTPYNEQAGFYTVGELGPETMYVPQGAAIIPHDQLVPGAGGGPGGSGGGSPTYIFHGITDKATAIDTMREHALRQRLGGF